MHVLFFSKEFSHSLGQKQTLVRFGDTNKFMG